MNIIYLWGFKPNVKNCIPQDLILNNLKYIEKYEKQYNFKMFIIDYNDFKELINHFSFYKSQNYFLS